MSINGFAAVLARMKLVTQSATDSSLSSALGVSPQTVSSWKGRDSIPYAICVDLAEKHGVSLDWLLVGEGPKFRAHAQRALSPASDPDWEAQLLAQVRLLSPQDQRAIALVVQEKQRIRELEQQVEAISSLLPQLNK
ncbi:helix-turn-helix domain-containing protein [Pseudomonas japonica]|uniref:Bacteriophage CI repressor helix-turn-helix domain-containing protein n=1 Tax=Pseudomonas japonica TaxID=256466 RepID=A0A239F551_9PSED|nr:helix-turn-helix domain-containing protein [Pseudomonas japonica]SNS51955.1 Bacteriophage CI repressor helix-turn-helix domain-containing protein [Pseudomonas japonica]